MKIKATIEVTLRPFTVPNFVLCERPDDGPEPCYPLSEVDAITLDRLCNEFRDAVFAKAGKQQPPQHVPRCPHCARVEA